MPVLGVPALAPLVGRTGDLGRHTDRTHGRRSFQLLGAELYAVIGTAIVTATVTLLAVYLTNRGNTNRLLLQLELERSTKRDARYREKLEEFYVLAQNGPRCLPLTCCRTCA